MSGSICFLNILRKQEIPPGNTDEHRKGGWNLLSIAAINTEVRRALATQVSAGQGFDQPSQSGGCPCTWQGHFQH